MKTLLPTLIFGILPVLAAGLCITDVIVTNQLAVEGRRIQQADARIMQITRENLELSGEIASKSALLTIENEAIRLGITKKPIIIDLGKERFAFSPSQP